MSSVGRTWQTGGVGRCRALNHKQTFQAKLMGTDAAFAELILADRADQPAKVESLALVEKSIATVPDHTFIVGRHAHGKCNGTGEPRIGVS